VANTSLFSMSSSLEVQEVPVIRSPYGFVSKIKYRQQRMTAFNYVW